MPQDDVSAHMWLNLAAATGNEDARKAREIVAASMTPRTDRRGASAGTGMGYPIAAVTVISPTRQGLHDERQARARSGPERPGAPARILTDNGRYGE